MNIKFKKMLFKYWAWLGTNGVMNGPNRIIMPAEPDYCPALSPYARYGLSALWTDAAEMVGRNLIDVAVNQLFSAVRAAGILCIGQACVADVDELHPFFAGGLPGLEERFNRGGRKMAQAVAGKEPAEVERGVGQTVVGQPPAQRLDLLRAVVDRRDDQVGDFHPYAGLLHL